MVAWVTEALSLPYLALGAGAHENGVNATLTRMIRARVRSSRPSEEPWTH